MVFTRNGTDVTIKGKQKPAFVQGTVYFRHGAKSEPGNRDDLEDWLHRYNEIADGSRSLRRLIIRCEQGVMGERIRIVVCAVARYQRVSNADAQRSPSRTRALDIAVACVQVMYTRTRYVLGVSDPDRAAVI